MDQKPSLLNVLKVACLSTTCHALPNIARTKYVLLKLFWSLCYIVSISVCCYLITNSGIAFLNYDIVTKITVNKEKQFRRI